MSPSDIAEWIFRERHNITTLIERLKRDGLVRIERNNRDKRFVSVSLTAKGRKVLKQAMPMAREIVDQVMPSINEDDAISLEKPLKLFSKFSQNQQLQECGRALRRIKSHEYTKSSRNILIPISNSCH